MKEGEGGISKIYNCILTNGNTILLWVPDEVELQNAINEERYEDAAVIKNRLDQQANGISTDFIIQE